MARGQAKIDVIRQRRNCTYTRAHACLQAPFMCSQKCTHVRECGVGSV